METMLRVWVSFTNAWQARDERGGVTDDLAMIGLMVGAAVAAAGVLGVLIRTKVVNISVGW